MRDAAAIVDGKTWAIEYSVKAASRANLARLWWSADTSPALLFLLKKWRPRGLPRSKLKTFSISISMARISLAEHELSVM